MGEAYKLMWQEAAEAAANVGWPAVIVGILYMTVVVRLLLPRAAGAAGRRFRSLVPACLAGALAGAAVVALAWAPLFWLARWWYALPASGFWPVLAMLSVVGGLLGAGVPLLAWMERPARKGEKGREAADDEQGRGPGQA